MHEAPHRAIPLVVIGALERATADALAALMRGEGAVVLIAEGERACLRVATAVRPDVVLVDPRLPRGLLGLLRAHPFSSRTQVSHSWALGGVTFTASAERPEQEPVVKRWFRR